MTAPAASPPAPRGEPRNLPLQALRAAAAIAVLLYHSAHYTASNTGAAWLEGFPNDLGLYGVLAFFALSGFLMEAAVRRYDTRTFALHRVARLFPTFWLITAIFFVIQRARLGEWGEIPWKGLSLLPFGVITHPLSVEWTLVYELFFYAVCALVCLRPRAHFALLAIWLAVLAIAFFGFNQFGTVGLPTATQIPFSAFNVPFVCGGLAGHLNRLPLRVPAAALCAAGLTLVALSKLAPLGADLFVSGPGLACLVMGLARIEPRTARAPRPLRWTAALGDRSYGLYLAHCLAIQIAFNYVPLTAPPFELYVGMIAYGLVVGIAAGSIDIALYRALKQAIDARLRRHRAADIGAAAT